MVGAVDLGLYAGALFAMAVFVTAVLQYELEMGTFISSLTAVSVTAAGLMAALALQVALAVPFAWSLSSLGGLAVLFVALYELFA